MNVTPTHLPSNYSDIFVENILNEDMNDRKHKRKRRAEEGSSKEIYVAADYDGHDIDLNFPPKNV